jgi:ABC-type transport system involved in cytochrome c biogenesis ATPase subunit
MQAHLQQGGSILFSSHQDLTKIVARKYIVLGRGAVDE